MAIIVQTLSEQIYALVRDRIICGDLPADVAIRQDALAEDLGVSKIPLREAFARLEQDGLLSYITNRGYFVRPLSAGEAEEVYALRLKIEPEAVSMAALKATPTEQKIAKDALEALDQASVSDKSKVGKLNRLFHMSLVRPSRLQNTIQIIERLNQIAERYVGKHLEPAGRDSRAHQEHTDMLNAWLKGDTKVVEAIVTEHIASTLTDLRQQFKIETENA